MCSNGYRAPQFWKGEEREAWTLLAAQSSRLASRWRIVSGSPSRVPTAVRSEEGCQCTAAGLQFVVLSSVIVRHCDSSDQRMAYSLDLDSQCGIRRVHSLHSVVERIHSCNAANSQGIGRPRSERKGRQTYFALPSLPSQSLVGRRS